MCAQPWLALPEGPSPYSDALKYAILTDKKAIPQSAKEKLGLLIGKYL